MQKAFDSASFESSLSQRFHETLSYLFQSSGHPIIHSSNRLAVAVSGGSDSLALALLAQEHLSAQLVTFTVDHRLRSESGTEAQTVAEWMRRRGIEHHILRWDHGTISGNLQAAAREARYRLLADACCAQGLTHLLVGHTQDDQAETIALRRQREAGPIGLAGMSARRDLHGITLLRPLLTTSRRELRDYLRRLGQSWIDDPSNDNPDFDRIRIRRELEKNPQRKAELLALGHRMGEQRRALEIEVNKWLTEHVRRTPNSIHCPLPVPQPSTINYQLSTRDYLLLSRLLAHVGGDDYPPRFHQIERLYRRFLSQPEGTATLAHCLIRWHGGELTLTPESSHISSAKPLVVPPFCLI